MTSLHQAFAKALLQHLDDVEGQLEKWAYDIMFDE